MTTALTGLRCHREGLGMQLLLLLRHNSEAKKLQRPSPRQMNSLRLLYFDAFFKSIRVFEFFAETILTMFASLHELLLRLAVVSAPIGPM